MATTKNSAKTTTRTATVKEQRATAKVEAVSLDMLVKAYRTASASAQVKGAEMMSLKEQRDGLRVMQARAAVRVFRHPEVGENWSKASRATGDPRTSLRRYIECGIEFGKSADTEGAPSKRELKIIRDKFDTIAEQQAARDAAKKEAATKDAPTKGEDSKGEDSKADTKADENVEPTFTDVLKHAKTLATALDQFKATGKLTTRQVKALEDTLAVIIADAKKS